MSEYFCPRRNESPFGRADGPFPGPDSFRDDDTCSYCGSLNPDTFMARLEKGDVRLGATDKNYKVYVENDGGAMLKQTYRDCPRDERFRSDCKGPKECTHWVTREMSSGKFYFQHLSAEQRKRFVELLNDKKIKFIGDYAFYVLPFFCVKAAQ